MRRRGYIRYKYDQCLFYFDCFVSLSIIDSYHSHVSMQKCSGNKIHRQSDPEKCDQILWILKEMYCKDISENNAPVDTYLAIRT